MQHCCRLFALGRRILHQKSSYSFRVWIRAVHNSHLKKPVTSTFSSFPLYSPVWLSRGRSRLYYCTITDGEVKKKVDEITDLFFEARELLDDARASTDTVYFNEDMQDAQQAVQEALQHYENLLSMLSVEQRQTVVASIGLKIEELRAHMNAMTEEIDS